MGADKNLITVLLPMWALRHLNLHFLCASNGLVCLAKVGRSSGNSPPQSSRLLAAELLLLLRPVLLLAFAAVRQQQKKRERELHNV